jgi:hypothetical protein
MDVGSIWVRPERGDIIESRPQAHTTTSHCEATENHGDRALAHGDRVTAARDLETTQGLHISKGVHGIVAEDRGSTLVVFFDDEGSAVNLTETDLAMG